MIYEYSCPKCERHFDVVKSHREMQREEACPDCGAPGDRMFVPRKVGFIGASVTHAEYNPAFGCVVKNKKHREELAKQRGMVEVGNDFKSSESLQTHFEKRHAEQQAKIWEDD